MIVIGTDTHKNSHALAAVGAGTGQLLSEREIVAKDAGHLEALRWAHELDSEIVWAIEDCRTSPTTSSKRCWLPVSASCASHRS